MRNRYSSGKLLALGFSSLGAVSIFFMYEGNVSAQKQSPASQGPTINISGSSFTNVGTGVSVPPDSNAHVNIQSTQMNHVGTAVEVRDRKAIPDIRAKLPPGVTDEQILAALKAVQTAPANEQAREEAVKKSPIWEAIKESGPEVVAFLIKTGVALLK